MVLGRLSQLYILSGRGDCILFRDWRAECPKNTAEQFFRNVRFWQGKQQEAPPIFNIDGVNYIFIKKNGLYFVATTRSNISPTFLIEFLLRLTKIFKDYCGLLTEESIRTNFVLLLELLDEIVDHGVIEGTSTEHVKDFVFNEPIIIKQPSTNKQSSTFKIPDLNPKTTPSSAVDKPVVGSSKDKKKKNQKNEIFVDIFERISVTFNSNGTILNSSIDGTIQMKSYLAGNPELKLALNEDLVVGKGKGVQYGVVEVDDCNFHECVKLNDFESQRILTFLPPDGEFVLMNYRITGSEFRAPFRIFPFFELLSPYKVELIIKIRAEIPEHNYGGNILAIIPMPKNTSSVVCEVAAGVVGQSAEYDTKERKVSWKIKKFQGGTEQTLRAKITLSSSSTASIRKEIGPISLQFEVPMYNPSGVQVKYLRIIENKGYNPYRWVRYVTKSQSYVCRL